MTAVMDARKVPSSITPFPQESLFSGSNSGSSPYFDGPNSAPCVLIRKTAAASMRQISGGERGDGKKSHANLKKFCADRDRAFAVAVGKISACQRKQNKRNRKERAHQQDEAVAHLGSEIAFDDQVDDEELQAVIVERALKLRDDQAPESEPPVRRRSGWRCPR